MHTKIKILASALALGTLIATAAEPKTPVSLNAADYPTLQAAVDALPITGGTIVLPPGLIKLDKTLNLSYAAKKYPQFAVYLRGAGKMATTILLDTKGQPGLDFTGNAYWKVSDLHILNRSANVGALLARTPANGRGCSGEFSNVMFSGCYPIAAVYMTGAEVCRFFNCNIKNQLMKFYNSGVEGMTEGEAALMVSPSNIRNVQSPYCEEGTGGGSNTELSIIGCSIGSDAPKSAAIKIFGSASDIRIVGSYLHSTGFAAIYLDGTKGNLSNISIRDVRIECEKAEHALYAIGHVNMITIEGGAWISTKELILQEAAPVAFVDAGGPCVSKTGAATKWKISQLSLCIWDGWGYGKGEDKNAQEYRGGVENTAWPDDVPHVFMRFDKLTDSVIEPCEMITIRNRDAKSDGNAKTLQTVNGLTVEQAGAINEASFMPGDGNQKLRDRQRLISVGPESAGNRITAVTEQQLDIPQTAVGDNIITILRKKK